MSASRVVAFDAPAVSDTHRYSPSLVHCAATVWSCGPNLHSRSLNGCRSAPSTRTSVSPAVAPLAGLRLATVSAVWYTNGISLRLYCCPFIVTSTLRTPAPPGWSGEMHVSSSAERSVPRTASAPNLHRKSEPPANDGPLTVTNVPPALAGPPVGASSVTSVCS